MSSARFRSGRRWEATDIDRIFEVIDNVVKDSGVEQISGFGASSIAREKGFYYNKLIVHHYEGQGNGLLWSAFGKAPHALKELDLLPETTAFAMYADLDIPLVWRTIQKELTQLHIPDLDKALAALPAQFMDEHRHQPGCCARLAGRRLRRHLYPG